MNALYKSGIFNVMLKYTYISLCESMCKAKQKKKKRLEVCGQVGSDVSVITIADRVNSSLCSGNDNKISPEVSQTLNL